MISYLRSFSKKDVTSFFLDCPLSTADFLVDMIFLHVLLHSFSPWSLSSNPSTFSCYFYNVMLLTYKLLPSSYAIGSLIRAVKLLTSWSSVLREIFNNSFILFLGNDFVEALFFCLFSFLPVFCHMISTGPQKRTSNNLKLFTHKDKNPYSG